MLLSSLSGIVSKVVDGLMVSRFDEYLRCLMDADPACRPIRKTRYCLTYDNQYFENDPYPFRRDRAIVEIELREETQEIHFPEELKILKEVTTEHACKNAALARI